MTTCYEIAGVTIRIELLLKHDILELPGGFKKIDPVVSPDIFIRIKEDVLEEPVWDHYSVLHKGVFVAKGTKERIVWIHPTMGTVMDVRPFEGTMTVALDSQAWRQLQDPFEQLLFPGLMPLLLEKGLLCMHAGGVVHNQKKYLFAGATKQGKSSTIIQMLDIGAKYFADDVTFIKVGKNNRVECFSTGVMPKAATVVWKHFGRWKAEKNAIDGKHRMVPGQVKTTDKISPSRVVVLGEPLKGKSNHKNLLLVLLSLSFHQFGFQENAMEILNRLIDQCEFIFLPSYLKKDELLKRIVVSPS